MSISYQIKRARVRQYTPVQAATLAFAIATGIIVVATAAAMLFPVSAQEATVDIPPGQCWIDGCGRAEV